MSRGEQTIYDKIFTKYDKTEQMHVGHFQECNFVEIKNPTPRITQDWGGRHWDILGGGRVGCVMIFRYSRPLLIANALTNDPYSWQLLIGPMELV